MIQNGKELSEFIKHDCVGCSNPRANDQNGPAHHSRQRRLTNRRRRRADAAEISSQLQEEDLQHEFLGCYCTTCLSQIEYHGWCPNGCEDWNY